MPLEFVLVLIVGSCDFFYLLFFYYFFFIFFIFFIFFYTSFPLLSLFSCRLNWEKKKNFQKKKRDFKSQLFFSFFFFPMVARKKAGRGGVTTNSHQSHHVEDKRRRSLGSIGGMTEILRVCFISSILRHILSWLSPPNVGIERQKISRRDTESTVRLPVLWATDDLRNSNQKEGEWGGGGRGYWYKNK